MGMNLQKAQERLAKLRKDNEDRKNRGEFLKLDEGDHVVRLLPPVGTNDWCVEAYYHSNFPDDNKKQVLCPKETYKTEKLDCPICELSQSLRESSDKGERQLGYDMRPRLRVITSALHLVAPKTQTLTAEDTAKPKLFAFGETIFQSLLGFIADPEWGDLSDPVKGFNIKITRTGKQKNDTKYDVKASRSASPVANFDAIKGKLIDVAARVKADLKTYDQLQGILAGTEETAEAPAVEAPAAPQDEFASGPKTEASSTPPSTAEPVATGAPATASSAPKSLQARLDAIKAKAKK